MNLMREDFFNPDIPPAPKREAELSAKTPRGSRMLNILLAMTALAFGAAHSNDVHAKEPSRETSSEQAHPDMATYQAGLEAQLASGKLIEVPIPQKKLPSPQYNVESRGNDSSSGFSEFMQLLEAHGFSVSEKGTLTRWDRDIVSWNVQYVEKSTNKVISAATGVTITNVYENKDAFTITVKNSDNTETTATVDMKTGKVGTLQNSWTN